MASVLNRLVLSGAGFGTLAILLWMFLLFRLGRRSDDGSRIGAGSVAGSVLLAVAALLSSAASLGAYWLAASLAEYQPIDTRQLVAIVECHPSLDPDFDTMISYTPMMHETIRERHSFGLKGDAWCVEGIVLECRIWSRIFGLQACYKTLRVNGVQPRISSGSGEDVEDVASGVRAGGDAWTYEFDEGHRALLGSMGDLAAHLPGGIARRVRSADVFSDWNATFGVYVTRSGYSIARIDEGLVARTA
jgi:hypothetical protein